MHARLRQIFVVYQTTCRADWVPLADSLKQGQVLNEFESGSTPRRADPAMALARSDYYGLAEYRHIGQLLHLLEGTAVIVSAEQQLDYRDIDEEVFEDPEELAEDLCEYRCSDLEQRLADRYFDI